MVFYFTNLARVLLIICKSKGLGQGVNAEVAKTKWTGMVALILKKKHNLHTFKIHTLKYFLKNNSLKNYPLQSRPPFKSTLAYSTYSGTNSIYNSILKHFTILWGPLSSVKKVNQFTNSAWN